MKNISLLLSIALVAGLTYSCTWEKDSEAALEEHGKSLRKVDPEKEKEAKKEAERDNNQPQEIKINLVSASGSNVTGTVDFKEEGEKVYMVAEIAGLKPGKHAIHIHEFADCSSDDGKSAGGHWNPTDQPHGKWEAETGYHRGDIGNFVANENGEGTVKFMTDEWCVDCGDKRRDIVGKSIVIHEGADDFKSQPSGDAGKRVACGAIAKYK